MANNRNSDRNRSRSGSDRGWNNDVSRNYESRNYGNEERFGSGYSRNRGDWDNYNDYRGDNDWDDNRGRYGNQGNRRGGNNSSREYYGNDQDRRYDYGAEKYSGDRGQHENRDWWDKTKDEVSSWFGDESAERRRRMDEGQGQHRGKGPKGYARSDERIKEDVNDRLSDDHNVDASEIDVTVNNCEVTLTGTVSSRWEKRQAEDLAESVSGVKNVENRLRVGASSNMGNASAGSGSSGASYVSGKANAVTNYESSKS